MLHENTVVLGDCLEVLRQLPDSSVDSVVTDPPYGLGTKEPLVEDIIAYLQGADLDTGGDFMGKKWSVPSVAVWKECFRILKPGGHLLAFGGTRTFDLISLGLRAAGFENRDTIAEDNPGFQWKHGQGFPKSLNIGKALDKVARGAPQGGPDPQKSGYGEIPNRTTLAMGGATGKAVTGLTEFIPETPEAKEWAGWGTALKPSWEPILCFRKPVEGTVAENALKYGTGGMNIDGTRVRHSGQGDFEKHKAMVDRLKEQGGSLGDSWKNSSDLSGASEVNTAGRWPPNAVMVHSEGCSVGVYGNGLNGGNVRGFTEDIEAWECVPGCPIKALDEQSGDRPVSGRAAAGNLHMNAGKSDGGQVYDGGWGDNRPPATLPNDSGGASRFFPQFEQDPSKGRWPPNAVMIHAEGCKRVGTKKVKAHQLGNKNPTPTLGETYEGGDFAGRSLVDHADQDGNETVEAWDCVEGCPVRALDAQTGTLVSGSVADHHMRNNSTQPSDGGFSGKFGDTALMGYGDAGGASRFFPQFEGQVPPEAPFMYTGKATKREATLDGQVPNKHPTKKPLALMQWLVRLVTPKGGICLDPFVGSGTTCVAAIEEGMRFIGIERDPAYHADTVLRVGLVLAKDEIRQEQEEVLDELFNG